MGKVKLGSVCTIVSGSTPKSSCPEYWGGSIKWVTPAEISDEAHYIEDTERRITEEGMRSCHLRMMPLGTVLLSSRAPIGKTAITKSPMCCNQGFKNLICSSSISNEYLYHFLNAKTDELKSIGRGATFKEISKKQVESITIDLPTLDEQDRRTTVLNQIESLLKRSHDSMNCIDDLVKSRFVEMLKRCDFSTIKRLDSFAKRVKVGFVGTVGKYYTDDSGIPMVRTTNITSTGLDLSELKYVTEEFDRRNMKSHLCSGDVVIARHGKNGQACVYRGPEAQCLNVVVVEPDEAQLTSVCIEYLLNSDYAREQVSSKLVGSTQKVVNTSAVASLLVPTIPLALQQEFAAFVAQVDKLRFETQQQIEKLETLKKSLMQEYFG